MTLRIGLDARPALVNREGIGRYARELVRALLTTGNGLPDAEELQLFGSTLGRSRASRSELGLPHPRARLVRWRVPSKLILRGLRAAGRGVDDLLGGVDLFHHTQPNLLPVRRAAQAVTAFDALFVHDAEDAQPPGWVEPGTARRMTDTMRRAVASADLVLVGCRWVADDVARHLGADPARVRVAYLGCDHLPLLPRTTPRAPYVLTVARVDPRKNHLGSLRVIEALAAAGLPHRWIVAGPPGWRSERFEEALERSPARDRVEWRRAVPEDELARLYAGAALFLWPSYAEGYGLPPLEAMRAGVPVVAADRTTLPEVLGDGARLVDPDDHDALVEATRALLEDPRASEALAARGRARAAELTWERCARETRAAYRDVARASPLHGA